MTPQQLRARVEEALWAEDALDARGIRVEVIGHDVWLEGTVSTPPKYELAERIASQVGGVGDLTNNLTCTETPYDLASHRDGEDLRAEPTTDVTPDGRLETRIGPFGAEWDEATTEEGVEQGGPVGGDSGAPIFATELAEVSPTATDIIRAEEPWRYQDKGSNSGLEVEPVLPPDEDEV